MKTKASVYKIEKVSNMIFLTSEHDTVFDAWDETEFTERKLKNAMKRISNNHCGNVKFVRMF